jgi:flagellar basal-body rod protein FlgB
VLTSNVANVDTPGYTPREMEFSEALERAFADAEAREVEQREPEVFDDPAEVTRIDGNSVDLDREMVRLSSNAGAYNALTTVLSKKLALLRYAANDGRGA